MADYTFPSAPPKESIDWFSAKQYKTGFDYRDVWRDEHNHVFTVAKAMHMDVLTSIKTALDDSLATGATFDSFKQNLQPTLERLGWWGKSEMKDPVTGELRSVQLGSPRRLEIIYRTNMETARQAGQWERIQRNKATHPYLVYELGPSREHRVDHASWAGVILPVDHPWWSTHRPKNGWGCKCRTRAVSLREYERMAATGKYMTEAPPIKYRDWVNKRTGDVERVPVGIDPGWDYNPGASGARSKQGNKLLENSAKAFSAAVSTPVPSPLLFPPGDNFFTTAKGIDQRSIAKVLLSIPGAEPQMNKLSDFIGAHKIKSVFIKSAEMSRRSKAAQKIEGDVKEFLGDSWSYSAIRAFTTDHHTKTKGFTFNESSHVVAKVPASVNLRNASGEALSAIVQQAIDIHASPTVRMPWTLRSIFNDSVDVSDADFLVTWLHEISHQIHFKSRFKHSRNTHLKLDGLTRYGRTKDVEWHAEHIAAWLINRDALQMWNPDITKYIDELVDSAIKSN